MSWGRGGDETVVQGWTTSLAPSVPRRAAVASKFESCRVGMQGTTLANAWFCMLHTITLPHSRLASSKFY